MAERSLTEFGVHARELSFVARSIGALSTTDLRRVRERFSPADTHNERTTWGESSYKELAAVLAENLDIDMKRAGFSLAKRRGYHENRVDGGKVMSKILRFAVPAYLPFAAGESRDPDMQELGDVLSRSYAALKPFATTDDRRALEQERVFGVSPIDDKEPGYERVPFLCERDEAGVTAFVPSPYSMAIASNSILHLERVVPNLKNSTGGCPAFGKLLEVQWNQAVAICMDVPSLFQLDFAQLSPDSTSSF